MAPAVKHASRAYDNSTRARSSRARQLRVAEVAAQMLVERGYAATTMAGVSAAAAVSVPWLYKAFGPKPALVKRAYDVLLVGDSDPVPMAQRPAYRALTAETDPHRAVERYAAISRDLISRVGPLAAALLSAAQSADSELAELAATISRERLIGATAFTDHLAGLVGLAPRLTREEARDVVWTLISPEVYRLLVLERGWSAGMYEQWLGDSLRAALLQGQLDAAAGEAETAVPVALDVRRTGQRSRPSRTRPEAARADGAPWPGNSSLSGSRVSKGRAVVASPKMPRPSKVRVIAMPDLSQLGTGSLLAVLLDMTLGRVPGPTQHPESGMWINLVRLTDKALREYEGARGELELGEWLTARHDSPRLSSYFRGIDYLEDCVVTTHRAVLHASELRKSGWGIGAPTVTSRQEQRLRLARNGVEHTDDWLGNKRIKEGQVHTLTPIDRRMQIGKEQLTYRELASCIEKLYATVFKIRRVP
jgi:AcrR family transcriptional regulator